jgi:hypothetical protein
MRHAAEIAPAFGAAVDRWKPAAPKLDRAEFVKGLALLAGGARSEIGPDAAAAYWLALSDYDTVDFVAGVRECLKRERFLTVAAVVSHVEAARDERLTAEASARRDALMREAQERRNKQLQEQAERLAERLEIERATWADGVPSGPELVQRMLKLTQADMRFGALGWALLNASASVKAAADTLRVAIHVSRGREVLEARGTELRHLAVEALGGRAADVVIQ